MSRPNKPYYGEFSDDWTRQLKNDDRVEIIEIEDGEFGIDMGTKHVKFNIKDEENWDYDPPIQSAHEIRKAYEELQKLSSLSQNVIPTNMNAVIGTLEWVLGEKEELPDVVLE